MKPKSADLLVVNGTVLTLDANDTEISKGAVAVRKDSITAVGPASEFSDWSASRVIDAGGGIIMPGLINAHAHLDLSMFEGDGRPSRFVDWIIDQQSYLFLSQFHICQNLRFVHCI